MRIFLVGGGTGGHFYPLIAVAEALRTREQESGGVIELYYIGPNPYNQAALTAHNISFVSCPAGKRRRYASILNFLDTFKVLAGVMVAFCKLWYYYPDVIMSKGGYTSVPVVIAAGLLRIPVVAHDSDAVPGKATLIAKRIARYIGVSYQEALQYFPEEKVALTGIPIRKAFFTPAADPRGTLGITDALPIVFVTGGSLGAERINTVVLDSLDELLPAYVVVHQAGAEHAENVIRTAQSLITDQTLLGRYYVLPHLTEEQMVAAEQAADIIVSRAGSTTIAEIALNGKPSIIVPIPEEISHDQRKNAYAYAKTGAATVIEEKNLADGILSAEINRILTDQTVRQGMITAAQGFTAGNAAYTLADTLRGIANEH